MAEPAAAAEKPLLATIESVLKLATAAVAGLYVVGLLVTNVQLMELGIADFPSLNPRNIMTGLLFIVYEFLLIAVLACAAATVVFVWATWEATAARLRTRLLRATAALLFGVTLTGASAMVAAVLMGFLLPWGITWDSVDPLRMVLPWELWAEQEKRLAAALHRASLFADIYGDRKTLFAGLLLFVSLVPLAFAIGSRAIGKPAPGRVTLRQGYLLLALAALGVSPVLLVAFAQEVYPNVRTNVGGGQPQIAQLQLAVEKPAAFALPGVRLLCQRCGQDEPVITDAVAVWHQSPSFMYVSPLPSESPVPHRLLAIDLKAIRTINYLPKYVRISSGGRIMAVQPD